ncbi:Flagellar hook-length control protein FliK [Halomonas sp. THAF12]|uniref:flagellar hook-length control protein FliK n=1 Tax=Halomonas sp. THAF12 TaxID=2587849 RepID=UPI0012692EF4|nr:flagellar hook-length control protein FliK [Halomonas sp. THAF12]QFT83436.1 Flagellar hook-length control protein FliK [Halomonas sp. THAF12]
MSGITPLIDTLLHQVLGKRVDTPAPQPLNQPVKPTSPSDAARAVHSDSRLDARSPGPAVGEVARGQGREALAPQAPSGGAPGSALTHFSATARTIADLLGRFPAPPSAVSPAAPLLAAGETAAPEQLAQRLSGSIRDSGLFYESHLARWYRGDVPRQQLNREPQMLQLLQQLRFAPVAAASGGSPGAALATAAAPASGAPASGHAEALAARVQALQPPVPLLIRTAMPRGEAPMLLPSVAAGANPQVPPPAPTMPGTATAPAGHEAAMARGSSPAAEAGRAAISPASDEASRVVEGRREPVADGLQHLVRHQLEMLATPQLRWEGDVWSGLFMALVIQLPQGRRDGRQEGAEGDESGRDESGGWRSRLTLDVVGLGALEVSLWMREVRLDIDVQVRDVAVRSRLEDGLETLRQRLAGHGFDDVRLRLTLATEGAS